MPRPLVLAHRGWHRSEPENSLAALRAAQAAGCDGAEFDVRGLRDGTPVLFHDAEIEQGRLHPRLSTLALDEFRSMAPGATTLGEALAWADGHPDFWLNVEVKEATVLKAAVAALQGRKDRIALTSFDLSIAAQAKAARPRWKVGWISDEKRDDLARIARDSGLDLLVLHRSNARRTLTSDARERGLEVWAWGANWAFQARALVKEGVRAFITDGPRRLLRGLA